MAEANRIGFQDNLSPHGSDPTHYPHIQFAYPTTALPQANTYTASVPAYYNQQGLAPIQKKYYQYNPELRIKQTTFKPSPSPPVNANQRFVVYQPPKDRITPNPNRVGSRVGTAVPVATKQPKSKFTPAPVYAQYNPPFRREDYDAQLVEDRRKEKKVAVAGALELTMNSRSGAAEHPRRYKDNDTGEFLCGKWGWILAALLFTTLLTLSLLFGLGILGGPTRPATPSPEPIQDNTIPGIDDKSGSTQVSQGETSGKSNLSGQNETSNISGGSTNGSASTGGAGQSKGQTTVTLLPSSNNTNNYLKENATSTLPTIVPLVPIVLPPNQINAATNNYTPSPPTSSQNTISKQPTTTKTNQSLPSTSGGTTSTQPQTFQPSPATETPNPAPVTPNNQPSPSTQMTNSKTDTKVSSGLSTPTAPPSLTPSPNTTATTQNISLTATTTPTASTIHPNSIPPVPVGTPSTPLAPKTKPTPLPTPVLPPAPNYVGPAQYDFYPNYVLAQLAHQLSMAFHH